LTIAIREEHLQNIRDSAERAYPNECCGLLLGRTIEGSKILIKVWETENTWDEESAQTFPPHSEDPDSDKPLAFTQERRYTIAPEAMLAAQRHARERQLDIIGIYHSHPNHPAIPSPCDHQWAWQQYSYIIASVREGKTVEIRSWQLDDDRQFQSEEIRLHGVN
jgi:proteasome lid subunit RPN8/RPN11